MALKGVPWLFVCERARGDSECDRQGWRRRQKTERACACMHTWAGLSCCIQCSLHVHNYAHMGQAAAFNVVWMCSHAMKALPCHMHSIPTLDIPLPSLAPKTTLQITKPRALLQVRSVQRRGHSGLGGQMVPHRGLPSVPREALQAVRDLRGQVSQAHVPPLSQASLHRGGCKAPPALNHPPERLSHVNAVAAGVKLCEARCLGKSSCRRGRHAG